MYQISLIFIILIFTNANFALSSEISHPPTYEQIKQSYKDRDQIKTDLYEAFKYNSDDIEFLKQKKNINYIVAIAYQMNRSEAVNLLMSYLPEISHNYLGLSLLISSALREENLDKKIPLENLSKELIKQSPNNGYAYYLIAFYYAKMNQFEECINFTYKAVNSSSFNNHWADYSKNSISTSTILGYPILAAQIHALGLQHDMFVYYELAKYILNHDTSRNSIALCKEMGTILKKNSTTIFADYMSLAIQKKALEKQKKYINTDKELGTIEDLKGHLKILTESLSTISETHDIGEKRWEQYYADLYGQSEQYAIKKLMSEYPVNIK
jgi:hypothetical protein